MEKEEEKQETEVKEEKNDELLETKEDEVDEKGDAESSESAESEDDSDEEESVDQETLALAKLLRDPSSRNAVLTALLKDTNKKAEETGETKKEAARSIISELEKTLGDDWKFLAPKFAPIFDGLLNYVANMEAKFSQTLQQQVERESNEIASRFFERNPEAKKFEGQMVALMQEYDAPKNADPVKYLNDLYTLAKARGGVKSTDNKVAEKAKSRIQRNSTDSRTNAGSQDASETPKKMSLNEAIHAANQKVNAK